MSFRYDPNTKIYSYIGEGYGKPVYFFHKKRAIMYRKGIVALPVHDSFVVAEQHEDTLSQVMRTSFDAVAKTAKKMF